MRSSEPQDHHNGQLRLARLLEQGRIAQGLTQKAAAPRIGITPPYLNRLERGIYRSPSPRILSAAAELYDFPRADLFEAAGYLSPSELPTLSAYLHATCDGLPALAIQEMVHFCEYIQERYKTNTGDAGNLS